MPYTRAWWDVLGVPFDSDELIVKRAYRRLAQEAHPDRGGSTEKMQELNAAYEAAEIRLEAREAEARHQANPFRAYKPQAPTPSPVDSDLAARRRAEAAREAAGYHREAVVKVTTYEPTDDERWRAKQAAIYG